MLINVIDKIKLGEWISIDTKKLNNFYIIGIKDKSKKISKDYINLDDIKSVRFEVGIDCGIKNSPLTVEHIILNFVDITSTNNKINEITAFQKMTNHLSKFYIKPISVSVDNGFKEIYSGIAKISINVNTIE